jgi:hypothetical protein
MPPLTNNLPTKPDCGQEHNSPGTHASLVSNIRWDSVKCERSSAELKQKRRAFQLADTGVAQESSMKLSVPEKKANGRFTQPSA